MVAGIKADSQRFLPIFVNVILDLFDGGKVALGVIWFQIGVGGGTGEWPYMKAAHRLSG